MDKIIQMDLLQRSFSKEYFGFIGVAYPQKPDRLKEGLGYLFAIENDQSIVYSDPIIETPSNYSSLSIDGLFKSNIWLPTDQEGFAILRSIPLGRKEPGYVIYGANKKPFVESPVGDQIIRVRNGALQIDEPKENYSYLKLHSLLNHAHEWHNRENQEIVIAPLTTPAKEHLKAIMLKRIELKQNKISEMEFNKWTQENPIREFYSSIGNNQPAYLQYLDQLSKAGLLEMSLEWMNKSEKQRFDHIVKNIYFNISNPYQGRQPTNSAFSP